MSRRIRTLLRRGEHAWTSFERHACRLAHRRWACILAAGLLPVLLRLALLPWFPVPQPLITDEFAHLLIADTFAHGRITNAPHPLWRHFESVFILQQPSYTGIYQAGYGFALAIGDVVAGSPWAGVLLSHALALSALCWMLYRWMPPLYALTGTALALCAVGLTNNWSNRYLVVPLTALGGCLLIGALRPPARRLGPADAALAALGFVILLFTRPYDAILLSIPLGVLLLQGRITRPAVLVLCGICLSALGLMAYYNWRVTGYPAKIPYLADREQYGVPQTFFFQKPAILKTQSRHLDLRLVYEGQLTIHELRRDWQTLIINYLSRAVMVWRQYFTLAWLPLLVVVPLCWRDRRVRLALAAALLVIFGQSLYFYYADHYFAPMYGAALIVLVQALRHLRQFRRRGERIGGSLAGATVLATAAGCVLPLAGLVIAPCLPAASRPFIPRFDPSPYTNPRREAILDQLARRPGPLVVFVRYAPSHHVWEEYIYNNALIDQSRIVWAQDMGPNANRELLHYYPNREAWLLEPDGNTFRLTLYGSEPEIRAERPPNHSQSPSAGG